MFVMPVLHFLFTVLYNVTFFVTDNELITSFPHAFSRSRMFKRSCLHGHNDLVESFDDLFWSERFVDTAKYFVQLKS